MVYCLLLWYILADAVRGIIAFGISTGRTKPLTKGPKLRLCFICFCFVFGIQFQLGPHAWSSYHVTINLKPSSIDSCVYNVSWCT